MDHIIPARSDIRQPAPEAAQDTTNSQIHVPVRLCVSCRKYKSRPDLLRLTVDKGSGKVYVQELKSTVHGRSAYLCKSLDCAKNAMKGGRLKGALEGRKLKGMASRRSVNWPLEPQIIQEIYSQCTEP